MPTTVVKTIGTAARNYSTLQAWEDACPANLVTADQIWRGECYNDTTFTAALTVAGTTTDATRYKELTAAAGQSIFDTVANPIRYDTTKGVALQGTFGYGVAIQATENYFRISRIQINNSAANSQGLTAGIVTADKILIKGGGYNLGLLSFGGGSVTNSVIIMSANYGGTGQGVSIAGDGVLDSCTLVCPAGSTTGPINFNYSNGAARNNIVGGWGAPTKAANSASATYSNNFCTATTALAGWTGGIAFSTVNYNNITGGSEDYKVKSTSTLARAGVTSLTTDAFGQTRSVTQPTAGAYEVPSSTTNNLVAATTVQANNSSTGAIVQTQTLVAAPSSQSNTTSTANANQTHILAGAASSQANASSAAAIAQTQTLIGSASTQANSSGTGAIAQTIALEGAPSVQVNQSSVAVATQTHTLAGAASSQANTSSSASIAQTQTLVASASTQVNASSTGAISQSGGLIASPSVQANVSSTGVIGQTHTLGASASSQVNESSVAALTQTVTLAGAASSQANASSTAAITQAHTLSAAGASQANVGGVGSIIQVQTLVGAPSVQANFSSAASLIDPGVVYLAGAASSQANASSVAAIAQTQMLIASASATSHDSLAAAIAQTQRLIAALTTQTNFSGVGAIEIVIPPDDTVHLIGSACVQVNVSGTGVIVTPPPVRTDPILNGIDDYFWVEGKIVQRLKTMMEGDVEAKNFFTPFTLADINQLGQASPSIYVIYAGDKVDGQQAGQGKKVAVDQKWLIVLAVRNAKAQLQHTQEIRTISGPMVSKLLDAIQGWAPDKRMRPLSRVNGPAPAYSSTFAYFPFMFEGRIIT